ncbi:putative bifunctional diguanylate cyclase/phosphodiesterase [Congregibacter sp.]|jgi:diguanylate cyclase (GGDEF)-like protein|uniref:putative bifunctional diguanylate cyclase/phosphodiesterase n=1 Tax=Congregibacter sp. TaxID=2744308 RepID=UPI0039E4A6B2
MSIASKINALIALLAVLAGLMLTLFVGQRDYSYQRDALFLAATSLVGSQPHLQLTAYYREPADVQNTLDEFLNLSPAVKRVILYDTDGGVVGEQRQPWVQNDQLPRFSQLRKSLSPLDRGIVTLAGGSVPDGLELLSTLSFGEQTTSVTLPIVSVVDPTKKNLGREDFAAALVYPELVSSVYVTAYIGVDISSTVLWSLTLPTVALSAGIGLAVVFLFWLLTRIITRRITAPLGMLASVADDIASGKQSEPLRIRGSGEIRDIAEVLNGIITGLHTYTQQMDTDRKMLSMKVEERTAQLSRRKEELDSAELKVTETRGKLRHAAYFDNLTSLPNRKLFTEQLTLLLRLARRGNQNVGLLHVDIDNFKRINESLGSTAGDSLLREISKRLAAGVRDSDVLHRRSDEENSLMDLSRLGGDEFTVVLNQVENIHMAKRVAERLSSSVAKPYFVDHQEIIVTSSIGIALAPDHAETAETLLRAADTAMVTAKKRGRNRIVIYDNTMESANRERLQLENDLRRAVELDQLLLHYQPQVNARTGEVTGAESLVRWNHPDQGLIPPFKWIPIAEELGLIEDVGEWVLRKACADLVELRETGHTLPKVSVNVSALQFNGEFVGTVQSVLQESGLPPQSLEIELTEGIMVSNQESIVSMVQNLKDLGVRLSIDDFGTGYSSLSYLTRFPLDELKIDRSFVLGLAKGKQNVELVRAIIAMAKSLGLELVVEGVERMEELEFFRDQDADIIQGFLFSQPVPVARLRELLAPQHFTRQLELLNRSSSSSNSNSDEEAGFKFEKA